MENLMEEDSTRSLPPSDPPRCTKEPRTSAEQPQVNGLTGDMLWEEKEVLVNKFHGEHRMRTDFLQMLDEEDDQWQPMVLPVYPMAQPPSSLSFATVQWDAPDPSMPSPGTDNSSADELESSGAASLDWTVSPLCRYRSRDEDKHHAEVEKEKWEEMEGLLPVKATVDEDEQEAQPCDRLAVEGELTTEEEGTAPDLSEADGEILSRSDPVEGQGQPVTEDAVKLVELSIRPEESVLEGESSMDSRLKEEPERLDIPLTGQTDLSQEPSLTATSAETEGANEEGRKEEKKEEAVTDEARSDGGEEGRTVDGTRPCEKEQAEESSQSNSTGRMTGQLIHSEQPEQLLEEELSNKTTSTHDSELIKHMHELNDFVEQPKCSEDSEQSELSSGTCPIGVEPWEHAERKGKVGEEPAKCDEVTQETVPEQSGATPEPKHDQDPQRQQTENPEEPEHSDCLKEAEPIEPAAQTSCLDQQSEQTELSHPATTSEDTQHPEPERTEVIEQPTEELPQIEPSDQMESLDQVQRSEHTERTKPAEHLEQSRQAEEADGPVQSAQSQGAEASETSGNPNATEQQLEQTGELQPSSDTEPSACSWQPGQPREAEQTRSKQNEPVPADASELSVGSELPQEDKRAESPDQTEHTECAEVASSSSSSSSSPSSSSSSSSLSSKDSTENGEEPSPSETAQHMNGAVTDAERASRLAERLYNLEGIRRTDVVRHLDKDNDFSRAVGEAYLKFFDFTGQSLDEALRSFLKVVVLIGETQERERVLQHFSTRFHQCNPQSFPSAGPVLTLTCALMLLNTDLHGQNVGKAMTSSNFVSNLEGMNEGENFNKDLLKSFYNSLKGEPLEWAVDEKELQTSMLLEEDAKDDAPPRSKSNPFQDVPHNKKATVFKQGFLQRKAHANIDGKRIPWGKRSWKTFYGVLKGMVLYLQKDEYRKDYQSSEEVVSVHHALAERATDYTKKPHVFRLQTADWRVFLFQASSRVEMYSWIGRINLVSALHSSPPFPAAVGSQRRFCRPILPASQSAQTLERQLKSHARMLESFQEDLTYLQQNLPEGRKAKAKELEDHRVREGYLTHETCRYEVYIQVLEAWKGLNKAADTVVGPSELNLFDSILCKGCTDETAEEDESEGTLKKSHSSPSLELDLATPPVVKVKRNISERRTYRRIIIPRRNKEL